ncbi:hypothetical protein SESBI_34572 [Sesbania bispinosa]|nr:hypothetical protein SESBI_34572 [Sesbania bispinosa]
MEGGPIYRRCMCEDTQPKISNNLSIVPSYEMEVLEFCMRNFLIEAMKYMVSHPN